METIVDISAWILPVLLAITLHEAAHGWMAEKFGDNTARLQGRITFNPLKHIDRFGTVILPGMLALLNAPFLFGYAKPVPVDFSQLYPRRLGVFMVAIAGVCVNLALAVTAGLLLHLESLGYTPENSQWLYMNLYRAITINAALIVLNMLPILPLDGGRALGALLPPELAQPYARTEKFGMPLIFIVLFLVPLLGIDIVGVIIGAPAFWLVEQILWLTGNGQ